jgi:hypothetical protein
MKINGRVVKGPNFELIVIPRGNGDENIIMKAMAVLSMDGFDKACPAPTPPAKIVAGGEKQFDFKDKNYQLAMARHGRQRLAWTIVESLKLGGNNIEWDKVKEDDSNTWESWDQDFRDAGFSNVEVQRVMAGVFAANCLNEQMIESARTTFLRGMADQSKN